MRKILSYDYEAINHSINLTNCLSCRQAQPLFPSLYSELNLVQKYLQTDGPSQVLLQV